MRFFLYSLVFFLFTVAPAGAQGTAQPAVPNAEDIHPAARYDYTSTPIYRKMVRDALAMPAGFDFTYLRIYYTLTRSYDPAAERTQRDLLKLADLAQHALSDTARARAAADYQALVLEHLASLDVISMALAMAEQDRRFGDPDFYKWVYRGLLVSALESGDGSSIRDAYEALSVGEEAAILRNLEVKILKAGKPVHAGAIYYTLYKAGDPKTGQIRDIYINITRPMNYLTWEQERKRRSPTLPQR